MWEQLPGSQSKGTFTRLSEKNKENSESFNHGNVQYRLAFLFLVQGYEKLGFALPFPAQTLVFIPECAAVDPSWFLIGLTCTPLVMQCCGSGSGIRCLFDPWICDPEKIFSGSRISDPGSQTHIFESLETIFWVKSSIILWKLAQFFSSTTFQK